MNFAYTICYVESASAAADFFESAFGLSVRFAHPEGAYIEMATGATVLAFASRGIVETLIGDRARHQAGGYELALTTDDVAAAVDRAVAAGAALVRPAERKPRGQTVAYVEAADRILVEICTPIPVDG